MRQLSPRIGDAMAESLDGVAPGFEDLLVGFVFADVWSRPTLPLRERSLIRLAAVTALGAPASATRANIDSALRIGLSREHIAEAFLQSLPYAGFPRVIAALEVLAEHAGDTPAADPAT